MCEYRTWNLIVVAESGHVKVEGGSRREELNTPSPDYDSVALTLSYTGELLCELGFLEIPCSTRP